jgi:RHS repeat-associated protein
LPEPVFHANTSPFIADFHHQSIRLVTDYPGSNDATYTYDNVGNLTGMSDANAGVSQGYDAVNRLTSVSVTAGALAKSISYTYDNVGNRSTMTDPDSGVTTYTYDAADRLTGLVNSASQTTGYTYDNANRLTRKDYHNATYTLYTYDAANQLLSATDKNSGGTTLFAHTYQYDDVGNRTRMTDASGNQTNYTYAFYKLTGVTFPNLTTAAYTYDIVGNRTKLVNVGGTTNYTYDSADRLTNAGTTTYGWNNNGNQTSKVVGGNTTTYAYDYENRLSGVIFPDSSTNSFTYYPDGRRLSATNQAGATTYFFYDGFNALVETNGSGTTTARYTSGLGIDEWISMTRSGSSYAYHRDGLGSIIGLSNASQSVVATYQYDPFGAIRSQTGSVTNPYRFTGREYDSESGLYSYRTRYYDTGTGRFVTKDLWRGFIGVPHSLNKYAYVLNNPVRFVDPLGMVAWTQQLVGHLAKSGAVVGGGAAAAPGDATTFSAGTMQAGWALGRGMMGSSHLGEYWANRFQTITDWWYGSGNTGGNQGGTQGNGGGGQGPTVVRLHSFTARAISVSTPGSLPASRIVVEWTTVSEFNLLGFNLYRSETIQGSRAKLNQNIIPPKTSGATGGAAYDYTDADVTVGVTYFYWLEAVEADGARTLHGPASATAQAVSMLYLPLVLR